MLRVSPQGLEPTEKLEQLNDDVTGGEEEGQSFKLS